MIPNAITPVALKVAVEWLKRHRKVPKRTPTQKNRPPLSTGTEAQGHRREDAGQENLQNARRVLDPVVNAGAYFHSHREKLGLQDSLALLEELQHQVEQLWAGDLRRPESMLLTQAHTLQTLFCMLTQRVLDEEYLPKVQTYMSFALKAQAQCRSTIQALAYLKYPAATYVRQQNIGMHQQVNTA